MELGGNSGAVGGAHGSDSTDLLLHIQHSSRVGIAVTF